MSSKEYYYFKSENKLYNKSESIIVHSDLASKLKPNKKYIIGKDFETYVEGNAPFPFKSPLLVAIPIHNKNKNN